MAIKCEGCKFFSRSQIPHHEVFGDCLFALPVYMLRNDYQPVREDDECDFGQPKSDDQ